MPNHPPLVILAAGRGSRLAAFTNAVNKALLPIADRAVITFIIEKVPVDAEIIITLGYQGQKVKDYCLIAHPDRKFTFVEVDNYDQPGSGPGHSMMCCKHLLQRPFYFCTVDCIVDENLPSLGYDWIGVSETDDPQAFSTAEVDWYDQHPGFCCPSAICTRHGCVRQFVNKSASGFDQAFIGLAGVKSYEYFWNQLEANMQEKETELVAAFYKPNEIQLEAVGFTWRDTGTIDSYAKTKRWFEGSHEFDFDKVGEFTYIVNGRVIKYFDDQIRVDKRVKRAKAMKGVPEVVDQKNNFFAYNFVPGTTLYEYQQDIKPHQLFNWFYHHLWMKRAAKTPQFKASCMKFYRDKTLERLEMYKKKKGIQNDIPCYVNGQYCLPIEDYLAKVDWEMLADGTPVVFHGDLQFDNVIKKSDGEYLLLDWRDCFADQELLGDMYYDLAKLNGGFHLPYNVIKSGAFICYKQGESNVIFDYHVNDRIKTFREEWKKWYGSMNYSRFRVELLTTLIYLNMSPLHAEPFDDLVFYLSKMRFATNHAAFK
jgi:dTDP-glucose pyrophosphorylase